MENKITEIITEIFKFMDINPQISITKTGSSDGDFYEVFIDGEDLSFLIGTQGSSLDGLQIMVSQILFTQTGAWVSLNIDINGYKDKKKERIENLVKTHIDKVRFFQKAESLPPMNPWERRLVHMFVREYPDIESQSSGENALRHVVLSNKE